MLVSQQIIDNIDELIKRSYLDFTFDIIGDDFFTDEEKRQIESLGLILGRRPFIELLYTLVRQRSHKKYQDQRSLRELLDEIGRKNVLPIISDTHQYSIDHAKQLFHTNIEAAQNNLSKKIRLEILKVNNEVRTEEAVVGMPNIQEREQRDSKALAGLLAAVGALILTTQKDFTKNITDIMTETVNNAVVDEISVLADNPKEVLVYKIVNNDNNLCKWCNKFYQGKDGKPIIYKLSELQKNGSNYGKSKDEWLPVVGSTHPRCRCQLMYLTSEEKSNRIKS